MEDAFRIVLMARLDASSWLAMRSTCRWARDAGRSSRAFVFGDSDSEFLSPCGAAWAPHDAEALSEIPWDEAEGLGRNFRSARVATVTVVLPDDAERLFNAGRDGVGFITGELAVERRLPAFTSFDAGPSLHSVVAFALRYPETRIVFKDQMLFEEATRICDSLPSETALEFDDVLAHASFVLPLPRAVIRHLFILSELGVRCAQHIGAVLPRVTLLGLIVNLPADAEALKGPTPLGGVTRVSHVKVTGGDLVALEAVVSVFAAFPPAVINCGFSVSPETADYVLDRTPHSLMVESVVGGGIDRLEAHRLVCRPKFLGHFVGL